MNDPNTPTYPLQRSFANFVLVAFFALLLTMGLFKPAFAQTAPTLGTAQSFAVLGYSTVTNTGPSVITGDLGVSPGTAVTGFPPGIVDGGSIHTADAVAQQARADATAAFGVLAGQTCNITYGVPTDLGGMTLVPGVYCFASSAAITGTLTLDAGGNPDAAFIFLVGSTLITANDAAVVLIHGAQQCDVFWQVGSSATLGTGTSFIGTVIAQASVTFNTSATSSGRALALTGAVTLDSNTVSVTSCAVPVNAPVISKSFNDPSIIAGGDSILTLTLSNPNSADASITAPLIDTFPSGVSVFGTASTTCGGTVGAPIGSSAVSLTGGAIPANGSCTVTVDVSAPAAGTYINSLPSGALMTSNGNSVAPAVATLTVTPLITPVQVPPTLGKSFSPATISVNGVSTLVLTLSNSNSVIDTMTAPLMDQFPTGVTVDGTASTTCGGIVDAPQGSASVTLTGGIIPAEGSCTVSVGVTSDSAGSYHNSVIAGALKTDNGNNAAPAVATLTVTPVLVAPALAKSFNPATISANGVSTLVLTLNNSNSVVDTMTAPLTDQFPAGLTVNGAAGTTCGGAVAAPMGSTAVTLTGGVIPANGSCTVTVMVTASIAGTYINTVPSGALATGNGNNSSPAVATLTVTPAPVAPTLAKSFDPATISANGVSTLVLTLNNSNSVVDTMTAPLTDQFPAGLTVNGAASTTCGGAVAAPMGGTTVTLTGGIIPAKGSCTVTVMVTASTAGTYINTVPSGALMTNNGNNSAPAVATLTVTPAPIAPTLAKSFTPATISANGVSTLVLTLNNSNSVIDTMTAPLTDQFPAGLTVNGAAGTTCGGAVAAPMGSTTATLTGGIIPANGSCTVTVMVTASTAGTYINTVPSGALMTSNGNSVAPAVATLTVTPAPVAPTLAKSFNPAIISANGVSTLVLTLNNSNSVVDTMTAPLTDQFPAGLTVNSVASTTCGGTVAAPMGSTAVTLTGGVIPANGSCTVTVMVTASIAGTYINTVPSGALMTNNGNNSAPAVATLTVTPVTVLVAPTLAKSFNPATISANGVSTLVLTLNNSNSVVDTMTAPLTDQFPAGLTVNGVASTTCGGTVAAPMGSTAVTLTGGIIPANGSCTVTVMVTASIAGTYINTVPSGALMTGNGNNSSPAVATLTVTLAPVGPTLAKLFTPATISANGVSTLVLTLNNSNSVVDTMTAPLTDQFPVGLTVNGTAGTTCGGTVAAPMGGTTVTLTGGVIPASGFCTVTVMVTASIAGTNINTVPSGALMTNNGNNSSPAVATLTVTPVIVLVAPTLAKSFSPATVPAKGVSTLVLTLNNSNPVIDTMTAPLTDQFPAGLTVNGAAGTTCGGTIAAPMGSTAVTLTGGNIPANGSCTVTVVVTPDCGECSYENTVSAGALQTDHGTNAAPAVATLTATNAVLGGTPTVGKFFYPAAILPGASTTLTITLSNTDATAATLTAPFTDSLPAGMVVYGLPTTIPDNTCGGTLTASNGSASVTLTDGQIPANSTCAITVFVSVLNAGTYVNSLKIGTLKTSNGNNANQADASLVVGASASAGTQLLKTFSPSTINVDGISTLTITLMNPYSQAATLEAPLVDNMPAGMVVYGNASNTCGGAVNAPPGSSTVTLTGGSIPANGFCTMTVQVTAPCANYFNNLPAGALQTSNGGNQEPSGASLTVTRNSVLTITCSAVTTGVVGVSFDSGPINVTGGTAPYSYSIVGTLPAGLSLTTSTGEITGTPTASGTFSMMVTDANGATGTSCNIIIISGNASPGYTLNVNPSSVTVVAGQQATTSFTFTPYGGFVGTVGFSCSGLPVGATCTFAPLSVTANGSNTVQTSTLTITTTASGTAIIAQNRTTQGPTLAAVFFLPGLLLGSFIAWRRRSFTVRMGGILLLLLVGTILVSGALGCAGGSGAGGSGSGGSGVQTGTPLGTDVVTVVANANVSSTTSGASSSTQTATFTLTVIQ